jgi:DNA-binding CsgD family transcriptional regulator
MLTPRQREVAELVARGCTAKTIARRLDISPVTAEAHIRNAAARLPDDARRARERLIFFILDEDGNLAA